jgi:hypothetical protein
MRVEPHGIGLAVLEHMLRPIHLIISVYAIMAFTGCTAEVRPETPHEARAERREEHREERHEEHEEQRGY